MWLPGKSCPGNQSARSVKCFHLPFSWTKYQTLSQLEAEIQSIARVIAVELIFVTGCQGKACLATKLWHSQRAFKDLIYGPNIKVVSWLEAEIQQFSSGYQSGCHRNLFGILDFAHTFCFESWSTSVLCSDAENLILRKKTGLKTAISWLFNLFALMVAGKELPQSPFFQRPFIWAQRSSLYHQWKWLSTGGHICQGEGEIYQGGQARQGGGGAWGQRHLAQAACTALPLGASPWRDFAQ